MAYNAEKNMLHHYTSGEKILPPQVCGKKVLPTKSNGRRLRSATQIPAAVRGKGARNSRARAEEIKAGTNKIYMVFHIFLTGKCLA